VNRGGGWNNNAGNCRSANRNRNTPGNRNNNLGFRLALQLRIEHDMEPAAIRFSPSVHPLGGTKQRQPARLR
jgi:hypothetical protein